MRISTTDQRDRTVLDFHRCAMLPARDTSAAVAQGQTEPSRSDPGVDRPAFANWDLDAYRQAVPRPHFADLRVGTIYRLAGGDVVSSAPELARLTMNLASIHHDRTVTGRRLVYGGHTIGLAAAQLTRALPAMVTIPAWQDCDHIGPVQEGDTLHSEIAIERCESLRGGGGLAHLRSRVRATAETGAMSDVLDWRLIALFA